MAGFTHLLDVFRLKESPLQRALRKRRAVAGLETA